MKYFSAIAGIIKKMLSSNNSINGLQICMIAVVSMAVPSVFAYTVLSPAPPEKQEVLSVCRAPQRALLPLETDKYNTCELDNGDTVWKAFTNVNAGIDTTSYVEGVASIKLDVQDEFSSGCIASVNTIDNTGTLNLSDIECISFWIKSSEKLDDDVLQLRLIDNINGTASVNIDVAGNNLDGQDWKKVSVSLSGTYDVNNNVGSIALYATNDPGDVTIWLDIIEARIALQAQKTTKSYLNELVLNNAKEVILAG